MTFFWLVTFWRHARTACFQTQFLIRSRISDFYQVLSSSISRCTWRAEFAGNSCEISLDVPFARVFWVLQQTKRYRLRTKITFTQAFCHWLRLFIAGTKLAHEHNSTVRSFYTQCVKNTNTHFATSFHKCMYRDTCTSFRCAVKVAKTFTHGTYSCMLSKQVFSSGGHILRKQLTEAD
jgi:hypothetical protein